jgi:hypothetical protein
MHLIGWRPALKLAEHVQLIIFARSPEKVTRWMHLIGWQLALKLAEHA